VVRADAADECHAAVDVPVEVLVGCGAAQAHQVAGDEQVAGVTPQRLSWDALNFIIIIINLFTSARLYSWC
jgi:hypothetical protein